MKKNKQSPLSGKIAVVTGAESGIGQAIAAELARLGAIIAINYYKDEAAASKTLALVKNNGSDGIIYQGDVSDYQQVQELYKKVVKELGTPYILVNSAGINSSGIYAVDMPVEIFDRTLKTDLYGTFYHCKEFIAIRKAAGGKGKIVNISSIHEDVAHAGGAEYCASKGGVRNLTRVLALEIASLQINVNNIGPGMILTPMNQKVMDDPKALKKAVKHIPLERAGKPEEVAKLAAYLVSEDSAYATGQTFFLDGGLKINIGQGA
ncbi:SDR family oxidoreductase [Mucilaginibacter corticis]|uniref:SDR family oxidoreductase n=1 Tax=Mucilaginibacter corticis TaxID=2597670 RepID=A0A556MX40_9SPHI|nr:SDR family oxidoreductase [Mucilaginibacter corticis]TSJ44504.1 SDR family oxidoreductase [Mucilaginibacter corticis]